MTPEPRYPGYRPTEYHNFVAEFGDYTIWLRGKVPNYSAYVFYSASGTNYLFYPLENKWFSNDPGPPGSEEFCKAHHNLIS